MGSSRKGVWTHTPVPANVPSGWHGAKPRTPTFIFFGSCTVVAICNFHLNKNNRSTITALFNFSTGTTARQFQQEQSLDNFNRSYRSTFPVYFIARCSLFRSELYFQNPASDKRMSHSSCSPFFSVGMCGVFCTTDTLHITIRSPV